MPRLAAINALRPWAPATITRALVDGHLEAELDLAYPDQRIAIEIDGYRWHSTPEQKRRDERRQHRLTLLGWRVLRSSAAEVRRRPEVLIRAVRRALSDAS